jgi:predicted RNA-binding Zn ribbon-like protein
METPQVIKEVRFLGGNLALDLVNTRDTGPDGRPGFDRLIDYGHLLAWAVRAGAISADEADAMGREAAARPAEAATALRRVRELRSNLYNVFEAVALDQNPPKTGLDALRNAHSESVARGSLVDRGDTFVWDWSNPKDLESVLWPVVHAATELLTSGELHRIKRCGRCSWIFHDATKNRSRRWCSMEGCGTHEKSERFIARRRAQRK